MARTYQYRSQKAMNTNLKQLAETIAFLSDENIDTPEELEQRIQELSSRGHDLQYDLDEADSLIQEMKKLIKAWDDLINATEEKETLEAEKKEVLEKLRPLQKVQRSVDLVMMEIEDQPDPENLLAEEKQNAEIRSKRKIE